MIAVTMSCNDNPAATGGDLSPMTVIVMLTMLTMFMFLHYLLRRPRAREAKNIERLADDTAEQLSADEVAIIFGYLPHQDIMRTRVCKTWRDAAKKTLVPYTVRSEAADKIVKKLSPDMVENIFKFISGEEAMRTTDVARILSYLGCEEIMRARRVSKKWRDAAKMTVPTSEFVVASVRSYNAMRVLAAALPNLQQLSIYDLGEGHKYIDGEDPKERMAEATSNDTTHDINVISNFRKLCALRVNSSHLNGKYHVIFNFPNLQSLAITRCYNLKLDLDMLASLPLLKELDCNRSLLTGNLRSLGVLKHTLEKVDIFNCRKIEGNFMDLADFPHLKVLDLEYTSVAGDVRDIGEHDFPALESLVLPPSVIGGINYEFQRITDVPDFMHTIHILLQRIPTLFVNSSLSSAFMWRLSKDSPDWYEYDNTNGYPQPPFGLQIIQAGSRLGWRWSTWDGGHSCEINWLDPEPSIESDDYGAYIEALQRIEGELHTDFYRGYHEPPTEMEYRRLCEGLEHRD